MTAIVEVPPRRRRALAPTNGQVGGPPPTGGGDRPGGEPGPRRVPLDNAVLGTLFLIGAEIMFFAGLVSAFWVLRLAAPEWPPALQPRLPVGVTGANTIVLLGSSLAMAAAGRALGTGARERALRRLGLAAGLGATFLVVQGYEWVRLIGFGLTVASGAYGATFYTLIGAHATHVAGALVWLGVTARLLARQGRLGPVRACALYWHFVVALWPVLYLSVYLL